MLATRLLHVSLGPVALLDAELAGAEVAVCPAAGAGCTRFSSSCCFISCASAPAVAHRHCFGQALPSPHCVEHLQQSSGGQGDGGDRSDHADGGESRGRSRAHTSNPRRMLRSSCTSAQARRAPIPPASAAPRPPFRPASPGSQPRRICKRPSGICTTPHRHKLPGLVSRWCDTSRR